MVTNADFEPAEVLEFDTLEELDVVVSPFRIRLLRCFVEPSTVKQAAVVMGVGVTRLYRHVKRLTDHGFLVLVDERPTGKTVEKVYQIAASAIRPSERFYDSYGEEGRAEMIRMGFRTAEAEVLAAADVNPFDPNRRDAALSMSRVQLNRADLEELVVRVGDLLDEYSDRDGGIEVLYFTSVFPLTPLGEDET